MDLDQWALAGARRGDQKLIGCSSEGTSHTSNAPHHLWIYVARALTIGDDFVVPALLVLVVLLKHVRPGADGHRLIG